jgi:RNA-directed DNA polymerase
VIEVHVYDRVRNFLARRHKVPSRGTNRFSMEAVYGHLGILRPRTCRAGNPP